MKKLYEEEKIRAIALKIREYLVGDDEDGVKYTTDEMPDKVDDACGVARDWGWEDGYHDGYDDGYSDGQALFLTDFADWDISISTMDATIIVHNKHNSLILNVTVCLVEQGDVTASWNLAIAPNSYDSVSIQADYSDYHVEITKMYFSVAGG